MLAPAAAQTPSEIGDDAPAVGELTIEDRTAIYVTCNTQYESNLN